MICVQNLSWGMGECKDTYLPLLCRKRARISSKVLFFVSGTFL